MPTLPDLHEFATTGRVRSLMSALELHMRNVRDLYRACQSQDPDVFEFFRSNMVLGVGTKVSAIGTQMVDHWQSYATAHRLSSQHYIEESQLDMSLTIGVPVDEDGWEGCWTWLHDVEPVDCVEDEPEACRTARWLVHEFRPLIWDPAFRLYLREERTLETDV